MCYAVCTVRKRRKYMSHLGNTELLEQLFEEWQEKIRAMNPRLDEESLDILAEQAAHADFNNRS